MTLKKNSILFLLAPIFILAGGVARAEPIVLRGPSFEAGLENGALVTLSRAGAVLVRRPAEVPSPAIHRISETVRTGKSRRLDKPETAKEVIFRCENFPGLSGAFLETTFQIHPTSGDLVLRQRAGSGPKGVWGVSWTLAEIPLSYNILVPGNSGQKLTARGPLGYQEYDYPISWEAQLVIVEGPGQGFFIWAEDIKGRFKRLIVERRPAGWRLNFLTLNDAPFDNLTGCESVAWHLNVYDGDWRIPARRYREWSETHFRPTRVERQHPPWIKDIRACVIMGLEKNILENLPQRLDPSQTLLYLPDWRLAGYDRDYPEYDRPRPELASFIRRAHELDFRVMLHVNYFGVDPLNPLYRRFEPFQVRDAFGLHEKQWWLWERANPIIKFAYINPADKGWRNLFVDAMKGLYRRTGTDALHLDQTLCIYNDHNGKIEGLTMLEGNVALHRELRQALPQVALSGEGLNEVTCRHEAFAQRHVWGLDHTTGRWNRPFLEMAHPISSYLLRPYTVIYGYLGCAPPESGQFYAAWQEAYEHWGVIPTLKPSLAGLRRPTGFTRQFLEETEFWQRQRVDIDLEAAWPAEVAFPFRTGQEKQVVRTTDHRLICEGREISRILTGVGSFEGPGTIPGWLCFDDRQLMGLDPGRWYPYFPEKRESAGFHVSKLAQGLILESAVEKGDMALVRTRSRVSLVADLAAELDRAVCGARLFQGGQHQASGPMQHADGSQFTSMGATLAAHPPWKVPGSGEVFARFPVVLPATGNIRLAAEVALEEGAVGKAKSDGVQFTALVRSEARELRAEVFQVTGERRKLNLDLTPLAGKTVTVELRVGPGPKHSPSFDWARWHQPRVEQYWEGLGELGLRHSGPWSYALGSKGKAPVTEQKGEQSAILPFPSTVYFLKKIPETVSLPLDLARRDWRTLYILEDGEVVSSAPQATARRESNRVDGQIREGLFFHPPNHGRTVALWTMTLPSQAAQFRAQVGVRDRSRSSGVLFLVEVNGKEVVQKKVLPGKWIPVAVDLGPWAGQPIVLSLAVDSLGPFDCDWAAWGEPRIELR